MLEFNPYHKWLGISPRNQPPNHYQLLGIDQYESDPEVIDAAAERRMAFLHQYATGEHIADAQRLLNELAAARICLLDPERRRRYDQQLAKRGDAPVFGLRSPTGLRAILLVVLLAAVAGIGYVFVFVQGAGDADPGQVVAEHSVATPVADSDVSTENEVIRTNETSLSPNHSHETVVPNNAVEVAGNEAQPTGVKEPEESIHSPNIENPRSEKGPDADTANPTQGELATHAHEKPTSSVQVANTAPIEIKQTEIKLEIPDQRALTQAERQIPFLFEKEFRLIGRPEGKSALAKKLVEYGQQPDLDPAQRYASLTKAKTLADAVADDKIAEDALAEIDRWFDTDIYAMRIATLRRHFDLAQQPEDYANLTEKALQTVQDAIRAGQYASALKIAILSQAIARKSHNSRLAAESRLAHDRAEQLRDESIDASNAKEILGTQPADGRANETIGQFLCFFENDWERGTVYLAKSNNEGIKKAAKLEQGRADAPLIGDAWWELADATTGDLQRRYQQRARFWYEQALETSTGSRRDLIASRLQQALDNPFPDQKFFLSDLPEFDLVLGPWGFAKNGRKGAYHPDLIVVNGIHAEHGIGMHPPGGGYSQAKYKLGGKFGTFIGGAVLAAEPGTSGESPVTFSVIGDERVLWTSEPLQSAHRVDDFAIDVRGVETLVLRTTCPGGANNCHACWIDPYLIPRWGLVRQRR